MNSQIANTLIYALMVLLSISAMVQNPATKPALNVADSDSDRSPNLATASRADVNRDASDAAVLLSERPARCKGTSLWGAGFSAEIIGINPDHPMRRFISGGEQFRFRRISYPWRAAQLSRRQALSRAVP